MKNFSGYRSDFCCFDWYLIGEIKLLPFITFSSQYQAFTRPILQANQNKWETNIQRQQITLVLVKQGGPTPTPKTKTRIEVQDYFGLSR